MRRQRTLPRARTACASLREGILLSQAFLSSTTEVHSCSQSFDGEQLFVPSGASYELMAAVRLQTASDKELEMGGSFSILEGKLCEVSVDEQACYNDSEQIVLTTDRVQV